ncbi:unnamed protein product [Urochloa decumbens]|uniref:Uncharacterized protein n=1 Tax=Urochloa decumbens TaxID=240449 RepID=A0ABC9FGF7_9POAL
MSSIVVTKDPLLLVRSSSEPVATSSTIKLSPFDEGHVFYRFTALLVFDQPIHQQAASTIKTALSHTLVHYYPFSGRITSCADADNEFQIQCTDEGVEFVAASASCALKEVKSFDGALLGELVVVDSPHRGRRPTDPLLSLQVTEFSCGGFILGVTWNHAVADGVGIAQFVAAVGELARGSPSPSVVPIRWDDAVSSCSPPFSAVRQAMIMSPQPLALVAIDDIAIPMSSIDRVRAEFRSSFSGQRCTTFEVAVAILWQCRTRAIAPDPPETPVFVSFVADVREHVGAKDGYYGNCIADQVVRSTSSAVASTDVTNLVAMIKHAKDHISDQFKKKDASDAERNQLQGLGGRYHMLLVSSWRNLGFHKADFGSGGPARVMSHGSGTPAPVCIMFGPCKGKDGATVLSVSVKEEHATAFLRELARFT